MAYIVHRELSYAIIGILFKIYNDLGGGYQEKYYQSATKHAFDKVGIPCLEQVRADLMSDGKFIGRYYMDFIVDHKIVLEVKVKCFFTQKDIRQVLGYLKRSNLDLGILVSFADSGLKFKRILRGYN